MITPDECVSLLDCTPPQEHCRDCSHAYFYGELLHKGRMHRFMFNPQYGVDFLTVNGDVRAVQPSEKSKLWELWEEWHDKRFA